MNAPTPVQIAAFLRRYSPQNYREPREKLVPAVAWYNNDGRAGVLRAQGRIVAVALVRVINDMSEAGAAWYHRENGPIVWVDDIVSRHARAIPILLSLAVKRFGPRETFAGHVFSRNGELRMLPWKTVERLTMMQHCDVHHPARPAGRA